MIYAVADADVDHALALRKRWVIALAILTLPGFPVGLLLPAVVWMEARAIDANRGLTVHADGTELVVTHGGRTVRLDRSKLHAQFVRDTILLRGDVDGKPLYWTFPSGSDDAAVATWRALGIQIAPRQTLSGREIAGIATFVLVDRGLVIGASVAALATVMSFVGAALGETSVVWGLVGLAATTAILVVRVLAHSQWAPR